MSDEWAYPLAWPPGWPRTPAVERSDGRYHFRRPGPSPFWTFAAARDALSNEVRMLTGGANLVISSNFKLARSGQVIESARRPEDQGIAIYFEIGGKAMAMARDRYVRAEENMRSLALAIEAMRALDRHGGSSMLERAFEGFAALPAPGQHAVRSWWSVLGLARSASRADIEAAYRTLARTVHPDAGGSDAAMAELNAARIAALKEKD